jgi:hypothetical protein
MLLPHKHVRFGSSLIAIAGFIREHLYEPRTLDELWALIDSNNQNRIIRPTFTQLVLAVDILFSIQEAKAGPDGRVSLVQGHTNNDASQSISSTVKVESKCV